MKGRQGSPPRQWRVMDLHLHTPASSDYQEPDIGYMDVLRRCEARGLDIVAFADHNTVAGYRRRHIYCPGFQGFVVIPEKMVDVWNLGNECGAEYPVELFRSAVEVLPQLWNNLPPENLR